MIAKIATMPGCSKCQMLKDMCPDTEAVELDQATLRSLVLSESNLCRSSSSSENHTN